MLIDGNPENRISALDRGLHYGDGLFETVSVIDGDPCLWNRHMSRLDESCRRLGIPGPDQDTLLDECRRVAEDAERCVVKILVTRGEGGRGYMPPDPVTPRRVIYSTPWPQRAENWHTDGVRVRICSARLASTPSLAGIKHLNRLPQVMARAEWHDPEIAEGLMLDGDDRVIEGTMSNLFMVSDDRLVTPDLTNCGVAGVMQGKVIEMASQLNIPIEIRDITLDMLRNAQGLFLTNSVIGIWPVKEVEGRKLDISSINGELVNSVMEQGFSF
ncbi:aminodeoxychorismate lyase [Solemya velesiana gill symbiont]|uniref:Aminodeoxychorismate lyase n=1 Tax=Solemya velesiana gill symbiont TaxID=1918948 RepID=A0A1T2KSL3_9GAMM|nr:aminodeoxychorismate lyase [Solemya velesiana gill symbiont]OOZ35859.1 aminodeoxychorismate lyase [Solemya velesiana gill symbiont]